MVVCSTPMMPLASATCPITPAAIHPFPNGLCAVNPMSAITCNQRYPQTTIIAPGPLLNTTSAPLPGMRTPPQVIRCAQGVSAHTTPNSSPPPVNCNVVPTNGTAVLTYTPVPSNFIPFNTNYQIVPYNQTDPTQGKLANSQTTTTVSSVVPCSPTTLYNCNPALPTSAIVPCSQRVVNGTSVLQCTPGVCQITTTAVYPSGTVEMCPVPSSPVIPNNPGVFPLTPPMSITQKLCTAAATAWKQSYGMEQVWQCEFQTLFQHYSPHMWTLLPVNQQPNGIWHTNVDSAKVRFCCEDCGHGWTSMKGRVAFWFILNPASTEGVVCLKLYGQQCDRCKTGNYEPAMWYPEEVIKVLVNIYNRVGQVYYGFTQAPYHKTRRPGKPRTPHNSDLCQACKDGVCAERR